MCEGMIPHLIHTQFSGDSDFLSLFNHSLSNSASSPITSRSSSYLPRFHSRLFCCDQKRLISLRYSMKKPRQFLAGLMSWQIRDEVSYPELIPIYRDAYFKIPQKRVLSAQTLSNVSPAQAANHTQHRKNKHL